MDTKNKQLCLKKSQPFKQFTEVLRRHIRIDDHLHLQLAERGEESNFKDQKQKGELNHCMFHKIFRPKTMEMLVSTSKQLAILT